MSAPIPTRYKVHVEQQKQREDKEEYFKKRIEELEKEREASLDRINRQIKERQAYLKAKQEQAEGREELKRSGIENQRDITLDISIDPDRS